MSDKIAVNIALEDYFAYLTSQVSAGNQLKNAVNDLLARKDNSDFGNTGKTKIDEWDVLDQSYISIKLQNAFTEIESKADALQDSVTNLRKGETKRNLSLPETSTEEVLSLVLSIISELYQYHKAVADCLAPLVEYSVYRERYPTKYEMKECSSVPVTWKAVSEVNRSLRYGYGLNKEDLASILSWKHGEDLSESARKNLNQRVDSLVQTYKERLGNLDTCEVDVPIAFQLYPLVLQDILKDCCSPVESIAAVGQVVPSRKEELDTLILREIPKIQLQIGDTVYEVASPGKAFENTKQKMYAVRHLVSKAYKSQKIQINKEQLDLCSLKVLATACISIANASSRTAVVMAFGKANLIQVKPSPSKIDDPPAQITLDSGCILVEVPSQWSLVEDSELLSSLSRDMNSSFPIATVDTIYRGSLDVKAELERRAQSLPVVRIQRCSGMLNSKAADKKDQSSRGIRKRLSRATQKLFNRKSISGMPQKTSAKQGDGQDYIDASSGIVNPAAIVRDGDDAAPRSGAENSTPVPPPRPRRKARKKKKSESSRRHQREIEEAKRDPQWFSSCRKLQAPETTESKAPINSLSVASFEELRDVIDFLSGSSTSSLCLSQPMDSDKTSLRKAVTSKEVQAAVVIDDKGKVSPSDSGIGSTMSVRSHPSIGSITGLSGHERVAKLDGGRPKIGESAKKKKIVINEEGKLELESEESDDEQQDHKVVSLHSKLDFETHKNSVVEDAEVERYIRKSSSCLKLAEERKIENEDACKTPTMTRTSSTSSDSDNEASVQDVIDDLKASLEFQKGNIDTTSPRAGSEIVGQKGDKFFVEGENLEVDIDSEAAVVSDHLSYDADGSEESEESNPLIDQAKSRSSTTLHGSTESLYYSAWTLNEPKTEAEDNLEDQSKVDEQTDSFFTSGLKETSLTESLDGTEEFQDCEQPTERLYGNFNTRFPWPDEFGEHFAAIWGGKDAKESEISPPAPKGGVWSPGASLATDKRFQPHPHQEGTRYNQVHPTVHFNTLQVNPPLDWKQRKPEEVGAAQTHEEQQWSGVSSPSLKRQHEFQDHHSEWKLRNAQHAGSDRRSNLHASITRGGFASAPHVTQPQLASGGWASSGHMNRSSGLSIQHGPSFARPSSVPAQISRPFVPPSTRAYNQAGFDFETSAAARHAPSPLFNNSSSSNPTGLAQYQNWSRESGSDPVIGGSNKRQISEYEALALQQTQARNQMINRRLQQGQNQPHWS